MTTRIRAQTVIEDSHVRAYYVCEAKQKSKWLTVRDEDGSWKFSSKADAEKLAAKIQGVLP